MKEFNVREFICKRWEKLEKDGDCLVFFVVYGNVLFQESQEIFFNEENVFFLQGILGSVGCVEGYVKICGSLEVNFVEEENLIIVVFYIDVGWVFLLLKVKGIIVEVGGQLFYGVIIVWEYGILVVMNIFGVMICLQNG